MLKEKKEKTIIDMLLNQVKQTPDNVAVEYEDDTITYKKLLENSKKIAHQITNNGIRANEVVLLYLPRGIEMISSMLGVLLAGAAYLPLDMELPDERIRFIMKDSGAKQLIVSKQEEEKELFESFRKNVKLIVVEEVTIREVKTEFKPVPVAADDLAYIIYTSGTTGAPKGVMIEHIGVTKLIRTLQRDVYHFQENAIRVAMLSPFHFDASVDPIYYALLSGHCLCIVPKATATDGRELLDFFDRKRITLAECVPTHFELLIQSNQSFENKMVVRHFAVGGESLYLSTLKKFYNKCTINLPKITNAYGPTECCVEATIIELDMDYLEELGYIPIGKALGGYEIYILDENKKEVAPGEKGEIYIVSEGLARGYINNLKLTEERFVLIEVGIGDKKQKKRAYKTGDYGEIMPDGNIKFLGREDEQVKIRGYRIELGEIEAKILEYDGIRQAIVKAVKNDIGINLLCALFTGEAEISIRDLRHYLLAELPNYMVPQKFIQMDQFPYLSNGKIDRQAIQAEFTSLEESVFDDSDSTERKLSCLWTDIIGSDDFDANENLMNIGGNSMNLIIFTEKIKSALHIDIKITDFFRHHSIEKLAIYIDSKN